MQKIFKKVLDAAAGPVLTVVFTLMVARHLAVNEALAKGIGAAIAGLLILLIIQFMEELPKRSASWRRRTDARAAYEGWWFQIHRTPDRVAVFSFLYAPESDTYLVEGHAFNADGELLAHWKSTQTFFSTAAQSASYLWSGKTYEGDEPVERKGTTSLSVQRSRRSLPPRSGHGEVLHINQKRTLVFRLQRIVPEMIEKLLGRSIALDDLADYELQRQLAVAFLRQQTSDATSHQVQPDPPQEPQLV